MRQSLFRWSSMSAFGSPNRRVSVLLSRLVVVGFLAGCAPSPLSHAPSPAEIPALEERVTRDPTDLDALARLGAAYRQADRLHDAESVLQRVIDQRPGDPRATGLLGLTFEDLGQPARARVLYLEYLRSGRSSAMRRQLQARIPLLDRQELQNAVREAIAREAEISPSPPEARTVAVFPFAYSGEDPDLRPLSRALADMLVTDLSQTDQLRVLERAALQFLTEEMQLADAGLIDPATAARGGRLLGAGRIVQGQIGGGEQLLRLQAAVVGADGEWDGQGITEEDALQRLFDLQKRLALRVYSALGIELTASQRSLVERRQTESVQALLAYGRCLEAGDEGDFQAAAQLCADAVAIDPGFSAARDYAAVARSASDASQTSTAQLTLLGASELLPPATVGLDEIQVLVPDPLARDPAAEVLGTEGLGRSAIIEIIIRRP